MKIGDNHLTYCMNVHPARTMADVLKNIDGLAAGVKAEVSPVEPFGLGIWLPVVAAKGFHEQFIAFADVLAEHDLYVFTINGFPYNTFHGETVKSAVYYPDWSEQERVDFTTDLIDVLSVLLPEGVSGSISTVPVTYGKSLPDGAIDNLLKIAEIARESKRRTGKTIQIALEPEPDCYLENTAETLAFFDLLRARDPEICDVIGMCFDTCHLALQGEDLYASYQAVIDAGIPIPKVQVSAALICDNSDGESARALLAPYDEKVYLHQTRVWTEPDAEALRFPDLGPALVDNPVGEWRVHFHVPLHFEGDGALRSTISLLHDDFIQAMLTHTPHIEIETYTFDVLPEASANIVESIAAEFAYLQPRLAAH
jgi:sugar phosphate isomerase/epimerase